MSQGLCEEICEQNSCELLLGHTMVRCSKVANCHWVVITQLPLGCCLADPINVVFALKEGESKWQSERFSVRDISTLSYSIPDLQPDTRYQLTVQARNGRGLSEAQNPPETFYTLPGMSRLHDNGYCFSDSTPRQTWLENRKNNMSDMHLVSVW